MDYIFILAFIFILIFLILFGIFKYFENKQDRFFEEKAKSAKENAAKKIKLVHSDDLISVEDDSRGIISKTDNKVKPHNLKKDTLAKWVNTESYEEDVKTNINTDNNIENDEDMKKILIKPLILLVDDSLVVRKYVGDLLKANHYELVTKNDGWEAITYLNGNFQKPDLIITDIQMPNMDGFQLIEAIRKEKKFKRVPIIVISAHVEAHDHLELMENEIIQGFIRKPFEDGDLLNQAKYILQNY